MGRGLLLKTEAPSGFARLLRGAVAFGRATGLLKQMGGGGGPATSTTRYADQFLGDENWLSPNLPLDAKSPPGTPVRGFQYIPGQNIAFTPRSSEPLNFDALRQLADYSISRAIIEHVIAQLLNHEWDIVPDDESQGQHHTADIKAVKDFFEYPDRTHSWDEWFSMLLRDALEVDAPAVYPHMTRGGKLYALEITDGTRFKVLIDERGYTPEPPAPAYQQVLYGVVKGSYTRDELIYAPRNRRSHKAYGFPETEQAVIVINMAMRREFYNLASFTTGNIPAGLIEAPENTRPEDIAQYQQYLDNVLGGDAQNRAKMKVVPKAAMVRFQDPFELHNTFDEWYARLLCYFWGVSPIPFIKMTNRSVAESMSDDEAEGGVARLKMWSERLMNLIMDRYLLKPHLRFNWITDRTRLQAKRVEANVTYVSNAVKTPNEVREEQGLESLPGGDQLYFKGVLLGTPPPGPFGAPTPHPAQEPPSPDRTSPTHDTHAQDHQPGHVIPAAGPKPPPAATDEATRKAFLAAREQELRQWERWASKRIEKGAGLTGFKAEFIDAEEASEIEAALVKSPIDEVKHLFENRRRKVPSVRLPSQTTGDAVGYKDRLRAALTEIMERHAISLARGPGEEKRAAASVIPEIRIEPVIKMPDQPAPIINFSPVIQAGEAPRVTVEPRIEVAAAPAPVVNVSVPKQEPPVIKFEPKISVPQAAPPQIVNKIESPAPAAPLAKAAKHKKYRVTKRDDNGNIVEFESTE